MRRTHPQGSLSEWQKTDGGNAVEEQWQDRQLPGLDHGIAEVHQFEFGRHTVPLVESRGLRKISLRGQTCSYERWCQ
jgi:hypothetical protein